MSCSASGRIDLCTARGSANYGSSNDYGIEYAIDKKVVAGNDKFYHSQQLTNPWLRADLCNGESRVIDHIIVRLRSNEAQTNHRFKYAVAYVITASGRKQCGSKYIGPATVTQMEILEMWIPWISLLFVFQYETSVRFDCTGTENAIAVCSLQLESYTWLEVNELEVYEGSDAGLPAQEEETVGINDTLGCDTWSVSNTLLALWKKHLKCQHYCWSVSNMLRTLKQKCLKCQQYYWSVSNTTEVSVILLKCQ